MMTRIIRLLLLALLLPVLQTSAREWDETLYKQIEQSIKTPVSLAQKPRTRLHRTRKPFRKPSTSARRRAVDVWSFLPE